MDTIKIETVGEKTLINFRREVGDIRKVRYLSKRQTTALGVLMTAEAPEQAINFDINSQFGIQIINAPYAEAFLSFLDPRGGRSLIAFFEGKAIQDIGHRLLSTRQDLSSRNCLIRHATHSYLGDPGED